jgi:hypothetical protein
MLMILMRFANPVNQGLGMGLAPVPDVRGALAEATCRLAAGQAVVPLQPSPGLTGSWGYRVLSLPQAVSDHPFSKRT